MGDKFRRFVEWGMDCTYVPLGSKCDICGKKLGFFATGFWSCNTKHVEGGNLCGACNEKLRRLIEEKDRWMTREVKRTSPLAQYKLSTWRSMSAQEARQLIELKQLVDRGELDKYGADASALLYVQEAFFVDPKATDVGVMRAKRYRNGTVVYGRAEEGVFAKGDAVLVDRKGELLEAKVIEAFVDEGDCTFELCVRANMGKQRLSKEQVGWILLDIRDEILPGNKLIK